jgi:hypothetical protein
MPRLNAAQCRGVLELAQLAFADRLTRVHVAARLRSGTLVVLVSLSPVLAAQRDSLGRPTALQGERDVPAGVLELTPGVRGATTLSSADNDLHKRRFRDSLNFEVE